MVTRKRQTRGNLQEGPGPGHARDIRRGRSRSLLKNSRVCRFRVAMGLRASVGGVAGGAAVGGVRTRRNQKYVCVCFNFIVILSLFSWEAIVNIAGAINRPGTTERTVTPTETRAREEGRERETAGRPAQNEHAHTCSREGENAVGVTTFSSTANQPAQRLYRGARGRLLPAAHLGLGARRPRRSAGCTAARQSRNTPAPSTPGPPPLPHPPRAWFQPARSRGSVRRYIPCNKRVWGGGHWRA